jgi:DNA-binding response OmpR family regulator
MKLDQTVLDRLRSKRFALIGFDANEAERMVAAFQSAGAFARTTDAAPVHPGLNWLAPFDAFVLNASAANGDAQPLEVIARAEKPAIVVGAPEEMMNHAQAVAALEHDFVIRPWIDEELLLRAYRALRHAESTARSEEIAPAGEPTVMVVDDDRTTTTLLSMMLRAANIRCEVAHGGREALRMVSQIMSDLLLLDISMPEVDGFQVLAALRDDPVTQSLPVMMLTVSNDESDVLRGFSLGVEDYVTKPFNPRELLARVRRVLRRPLAH